MGKTTLPATMPSLQDHHSGARTFETIFYWAVGSNGKLLWHWSWG
ncbi:hypothetical protein [Sodalinema gerasimenkoae]|nr:hypothetical protein [Sodalinema gerasimenkoae]